MSERNTLLIPDTQGLVLCGGRSNRMGADKSMLQYFKKPQRYHVFGLLQPFCAVVHISCNAEQAGNIGEGYPFLTDHPSYADTGPMAGLLTAFTRFPEKNILVTGCDYPFLTEADLQQFAVYCKGNTAVSFYNEPENKYEPLLAWYPYPSFGKLIQMHEANEFSLQHFLKVTRAVKFYPANKKSIKSIDTPEELAKAATELISNHQVFF